jgi:hypothetical protein
MMTGAVVATRGDGTDTGERAALVALAAGKANAAKSAASAKVEGLFADALWP